MVEVQHHWWFVDDKLDFLKVYFKNFCNWQFSGKLTSQFVIMGLICMLWMDWEVKNDMRGQVELGPRASNVKIRKCLPETAGGNFMEFLGNSVQT